MIPCFSSISPLFLPFFMTIYSPTPFTVRHQGRPWTPRTPLDIRPWSSSSNIFIWHVYPISDFILFLTLSGLRHRHPIFNIDVQHCHLISNVVIQHQEWSYKPSYRDARIHLEIKRKLVKIRPCHPTLSFDLVIRPCHPTLSSNFVIQLCHPTLSSNFVIRLCHPTMSSDFVIRLCYPTRSSDLVIQPSHPTSSSDIFI